ncbi:hypothetical protein [Thiomonas sp. FB-Cd]|uniref:hypothetical protein n=1 Tax=Thiomonas sp. FB-Cd TaxID=1158292 RepID=UPI0004DEECA4|nr:hypothetical protein [Thiomonas sp. FB-Cd]
MSQTAQIDYLKKSEALLVKQIDSSLEKYVAACGHNYVSYPPPSTEQNFRDLDKYCGDIVAALSNISALVLEVKYNSKGHLNDLNPDQNSGLVELRSRGVPVFYSYNVDELSRLPKGAAQQLLAVTAIEPAHQNWKTAITDPTRNLKSAVDQLLNDPPKHDALALALACFIDAEQSIVNSGIEKLTTKALLIVYDRHTGKLATLSKKAVLYVVQNVMENEYLADSKNARHLAGTITDLLSAWRNALSAARENNDSKNQGFDSGSGF